LIYYLGVFGRAPPEGLLRRSRLWLLCFSLENGSYKTFGMDPQKEPEAGPGMSPTKQALNRFKT
jgi:hypothetical protein